MIVPETFYVVLALRPLALARMNPRNLLPVPALFALFVSLCPQDVSAQKCGRNPPADAFNLVGSDAKAAQMADKLQMTFQNVDDTPRVFFRN